jgi:hypothetical protein
LYTYAAPVRVPASTPSSARTSDCSLGAVISSFSPETASAAPNSVLLAPLYVCAGDGLLLVSDWAYW